MNRRLLLATLGAGLVAAPTLLRAQQPGRVYRVVYFARYMPASPRGNRPWAEWITALKRDGVVFADWLDELREQGFVEGRNLEVWFVPASVIPANLEATRAALREAVARKPDVIFAVQTPQVREAQLVAGMIPIVYTDVADPVEFGFAQSLAHPGGNMTGVSNQLRALSLKLIELIREMLPAASRLVLLRDSEFTGFPSAYYRDLNDTARRFAFEVIDVDIATTKGDLDRALRAVLPRKPEAVYRISAMPSVPVAPGSYSDQSVAPIVRSHGLPYFVGVTDLPEEVPILAALGSDQAEAMQIGARQVARVLRGANPGETPVEQVNLIHVTVNLRTAKALGIKVPQSILARAERVIQ